MGDAKNFCKPQSSCVRKSSEFFKVEQPACRGELGPRAYIEGESSEFFQVQEPINRGEFGIF